MEETLPMIPDELAWQLRAVGKNDAPPAARALDVMSRQLGHLSPYMDDLLDAGRVIGGICGASAADRCSRHDAGAAPTGGVATREAPCPRHRG